MDLLDPRHEAQVEYLFQRVCVLLGMKGFTLRPLRRRVRGTGKFHSLTYGHTRVGTPIITVDLYTPRTMKTRKLDAILRVIAHELTHHQVPPRLYRRGFHFVQRAHHPRFWSRYKKNVAMLAKDEVLGGYFK